MKSAPKTHAVKKIDTSRVSRHEPEPLGPLWVITIAMGAFFIIAGLVIMAG